MNVEYSIDKTDWQRKVRTIPMRRRQKMRLVIEQTMQEALDKIKGYTGETASPVRAGEGMRLKHPGGWADVTTNLRDSIGKAINVSNGRIDVVIGVGVQEGLLGVSVDDVLEYAVHLDNMEGINVLGGIPLTAFRSLVKNLKHVYHA